MQIYKVSLSRRQNLKDNMALRDLVLRMDCFGADIVRFAKGNDLHFNFLKDSLLHQPDFFFIECPAALINFIGAHEIGADVSLFDKKSDYRPERSAAMHHYYEGIAHKDVMRKAIRRKQMACAL